MGSWLSMDYKMGSYTVDFDPTISVYEYVRENHPLEKPLMETKLFTSYKHTQQQEYYKGGMSKINSHRVYVWSLYYYD